MRLIAVALVSKTRPIRSVAATSGLTPFDQRLSNAALTPGLL